MPGKGEAETPAPFVDSNKWYPTKEVADGSEFAIEVLPGLDYGVRFLGVDVPRIYAANDHPISIRPSLQSTFAIFISGGEVKLKGASGREPRAAYGAFQSYVTIRKDGDEISVK